MAKQNKAKKRSLQVVNEHFELFFNAASAAVGINQSFLKHAAPSFIGYQHSFRLRTSSARNSSSTIFKSRRGNSLHKHCRRCEAQTRRRRVRFQEAGVPDRSDTYRSGNLAFGNTGRPSLGRLMPASDTSWIPIEPSDLLIAALPLSRAHGNNHQCRRVLTCTWSEGRKLA